MRSTIGDNYIMALFDILYLDAANMLLSVSFIYSQMKIFHKIKSIYIIITVSMKDGMDQTPLVKVYQGFITVFHKGELLDVVA